MSTTSRTVQATPGVGPLVAIFAAAIAGTALIVVLAYGQLTASQSLSVAPAAAPVPAVFDHGWSSAAPSRPAIRSRAFDKSHHAVTRGKGLVRDGGIGGKSIRLSQ